MQWMDVVSHLCTAYGVGQVTDRWIELWWRFQEGRLAIRQQQTLWLTEVNGEAYFVVASEVGLPRRARAVARRRPRLGIGTLVEDGDRFEIRITLPSQGLTPETLDHVLHAIAHEAVQLSAVAQAPRPADRHARTAT
jgi:predicted LPLAT superfamily acyltransferase